MLRERSSWLAASLKASTLLTTPSALSSRAMSVEEAPFSTSYSTLPVPGPV
jgi:hypothetical protein